MSYYLSLKHLIQGWWKQLQENNEEKKKTQKSKHLGHWKTLSDSQTRGTGPADVSLHLLAFPTTPLLLLQPLWDLLWPPTFILVTLSQYSFLHYIPKVTLPDKW